MELSLNGPCPDKKMAEYEARRQVLLGNTAGKIASSIDLKTDLYGNGAIASLVLGQETEKCNTQLCYTATWFDHPHPTDRSHDGECDFAAMKLCRVFHLFNGGSPLTEHTLKRIKGFFLNNDFQSRYHSENHHFLFRTSRHLMASVWSVEYFEAYGQTGRNLSVADEQWLDSFIRYRARRGEGIRVTSSQITNEVDKLKE